MGLTPTMIETAPSGRVLRSFKRESENVIELFIISFSTGLTKSFPGKLFKNEAIIYVFNISV